MNSLIYQGEVSHARLTPVQHSFRYPVYFYAFELDELQALADENPLFGYNHFRPVAIHDIDYLQRDNKPIRSKLNETLKSLEVAEEPARVVLVTAARYFNYVFNPISFFYCYSTTGELLCILGQVNNTFGEMHLYLLDATGKESSELNFASAKQFHVSPFFKREGEYHFKLTAPGEQLDNQIHYHKAGELALIARMTGTAKSFTSSNLIRTIVKHPLTASLTMPRILWQAAKLYWKRRLPVHTRPVPNHAMTIRHIQPTLLDRIGRILTHKYLSQLQQGGLQLVLPNGDKLQYGSTGEKSKQLTVHENRFFRKLMLAGEIGFGEAYTEGDWTTDDLPGLLTMLAANEELVDDRNMLSASIGRWLNYARHQVRANTLKGSSRNIREHYDLSNDFFATFLDPDMIYSSAVFTAPDQSLEEAQHNKLQLIIDKAEIGPNDHVLEIGCGWAGFAIAAAQKTGCRVTGITLSHEQLKLGRERVRAAGLEGQIDLQLCDYRKITGTFDKIVSIEMLEAVGHAGLKTYFSSCDRLLKPGGKAVIQVITIPDRKYDAYRYNSDWIRKHIFPGGHLPSIGAMAKAMSDSTLIMQQLEQYGNDYARTLDLWRQEFLQKKTEILELGYDEPFLRKWEYYLAYCQAGFAARIIDLAQMVLEKPRVTSQGG